MSACTERVALVMKITADGIAPLLAAVPRYDSNSCPSGKATHHGFSTCLRNFFSDCGWSACSVGSKAKQLMKGRKVEPSSAQLAAGPAPTS